MAKLVNINTKKPTRSKNNIFALYSPISAIIERADTITLDTELILQLPKLDSLFGNKISGANNTEYCRSKNRKIVAHLAERALL